MIIKKAEDIRSLLDSLEELKAKRIFQAYHTYGSMFLIDMGEKVEKISQGRFGFTGKNTIIVENYTWKIVKKNKIFVDSSEDVTELRKKIPILVGEKITEIKFDETKTSLVFELTKGLSIEVHLSEKKNRDIAVRLNNSNWIDIGPGLSWVEVTGDHV